MSAVRETLRIRNDECLMQLRIPLFFEAATLAKIRKAFELMNAEPWRNEEARDGLRRFFPEWGRDVIGRLAHAEAGLLAAKRDAEAKRRAMESFGSCLEENAARARRRLTDAKNRKAGRTPEALAQKRRSVENATGALGRAMKPKTDYEKAAKEAKRLESATKPLKAAAERYEKVVAAYNGIVENH